MIIGRRLVPTDETAPGLFLTCPDSPPGETQPCAFSIRGWENTTEQALHCRVHGGHFLIDSHEKLKGAKER